MLDLPFNPAARGDVLHPGGWHGDGGRAGERPGVRRCEQGLVFERLGLRSNCLRLVLPAIVSASALMVFDILLAFACLATHCTFYFQSRRCWPTSTRSATSTARCCAWWCPARPCPHRWALRMGMWGDRCCCRNLAQGSSCRCAYCSSQVLTTFATLQAAEVIGTGAYGKAFVQFLDADGAKKVRLDRGRLEQTKPGKVPEPLAWLCRSR